MTAKFLPSDVIGKQPTKKGDKFTTMFFGDRVTLIVSEWHGAFWFAEVL